MMHSNGSRHMTTEQRIQHDQLDRLAASTQLLRREREYEEWSEERNAAAVESMLEDGPQEPQPIEPGPMPF